MRHHTLKTGPAAIAAAASILGGLTLMPAGAQTPAPAPAPAAPAPAAPATPPAPTGIQYNGFIDGYYQMQFNNPKGGILTGRYYDFRSNTPTLALAELNVFKTATAHDLGFKTTLIAGDAADVNHGGFVAGNPPVFIPSVTTLEGRYKNIQQLYGTVLIGSAGAGLDFGKFYTPFGYEVTESNQDFNYSRSLPYLLVPVYHTGVRLYSQSYNGLVVTGILAENLFNTASQGVQSNGSNGAGIIQGNYTDPKGKFTVVDEVGFGKEKYNPDGSNVKSKETIDDFNFTYNVNANNTAGLDYFYGKFDASGDNTTENGYAVYYKDQFMPKDAVALRYSGYDQKEDAFSAAGYGDFKPWEVTATYEYKAAANFTTRVEYRHDDSNNTNISAFPDSNSVLDKKNQDTLTVAGLFTF